MQNNRKRASKEAYFPKMESRDITILEPTNLLYVLTKTSTINVTVNMQYNYDGEPEILSTRTILQYLTTKKIPKS